MDWTSVYFGFAFLILGLILDKVLAKMKMPMYFDNVSIVVEIQNGYN